MQIDLDLIRRVADERGGAVALAEESGVPYTTICSMKQRDWGHESMTRLERLTKAARKLARKSRTPDPSPNRKAA